jgi:hypothetical protein
MTIYQVNGYNQPPTFYVPDQDTANTAAPNAMYTVIIGTQQDAQNALTTLQSEVLQKEAMRFSICATFIEDTHTTWRAVQDSDPEDTICQVFNMSTGQYTQCSTKTEANTVNAQIQQQFLASIGLDTVKEVTQLPVPPVRKTIVSSNTANTSS